MTNAKAWQGNLVEAPEMVEHGGGFVLFYSANDYASAEYGMGYATCRTPLGPCVDRSNSSLVASNDAAAGPGHCFVVTSADGDTWMLYHAWPPDAIGSHVARPAALDRTADVARRRAVGARVAGRSTTGAALIGPPAPAPAPRRAAISRDQAHAHVRERRREPGAAHRDQADLRSGAEIGVQVPPRSQCRPRGSCTRV